VCPGEGKKLVLRHGCGQKERSGKLFIGNFTNKHTKSIVFDSDNSIRDHHRAYCKWECINSDGEVFNDRIESYADPFLGPTRKFSGYATSLRHHFWC